MNVESRRILNRLWTSLSIFSVILITLALLFILLPIVIKGSTAFVFQGTSEFRRFQLDKFHRGDVKKVDEQQASVVLKRENMYEIIKEFELDKKNWGKKRRIYAEQLKEIKKVIAIIFGPFPGEEKPILLRQQYGQTRWDKAQEKLQKLLFIEEWVENPENPNGHLIQKFTARKEIFKDTKLAPFFDYMQENYEKMLLPELTFYWQFLIDKSFDSHFFGGIGQEILGTIYLTIGALIFAIPFGVIAAIYLCEYAGDTKIVSFIRSCVSTLAGVPSIVFGLFGLAFFLNTLKITDGKSVLAGSMTLALMVLPTIIRASEEAILSVPHTYKEAAFGLGAGKWFAVRKVILPAALPGILTGVIISMGRAAGETAPIIFTAAVSLGMDLPFKEAIFNPTLALPWNIYNLCSEHEAVDEIRYVQYGMVFTLIALVLALNLVAIVMRAKLVKKMK